MDIDVFVVVLILSHKWLLLFCMCSCGILYIRCQLNNIINPIECATVNNLTFNCLNKL